MVRKMGDTMTIWLRLSWLEWQRSVWLGKPNRDFFWLTVLLTLTLILTMLLWGSQRGLLNKFVDVSIGYTEDAGIPIWVAADTVKGINRDILQQLDFKLYPYREVEPFEVALLGENREGSENESKIWNTKQVAFTGWAVSFDDPLWKIGMKNQQHPISTASIEKNGQSSLPLAIILNKSLFKEHFDCEVYLDKLAQRLPFWKKPDKDDTNPLYCLKDHKGAERLWLDIKVGTSRKVLPFQIYWQQNIPTLQDLAFLFPISTLNTLTLTRFYTELGYEPEAEANGTALIKQVIWQGDDEQPIIAKLKTCFPTATLKGSRLTFKTPISEVWLDQCTQQHDIPLQKGNQRLPEPYLQITDKRLPRYDFKYQPKTDQLTISCATNSRCKPCYKVFDLIEALKASEKTVSCQNDDRLEIDMIQAIGGYLYAFAYVENRLMLMAKVEEITHFTGEGEEQNIFYVHATYEDALVRFMFIDQIMKILEIFYSPFFLAFLAVLLLVQIGIVITHRKHHYGIYLSKGLSGTEVRLMVLMQMALSFIVAMAITLGIVEVIQWRLAWEVYSVTTAEPYIDHIIASQLDLLPLSWLDYLVGGGIMIGILYLITEILLKRVISARQTEPAYLLLS